MADKSPRAVRPEHIETFKTARIATGVSAKTIDRDLKVVRAVFKAGIKQGNLNFDPSQTVSLVSRKSKAEDQTISREVFQSEELDAILDAAEDDWKTAILIARYTGARLGNCVGTSVYRDRKTDPLQSRRHRFAGCNRVVWCLPIQFFW